MGDAALLSGLSLEALNDIGHRQSQLLIVLNDNEMSISPSVGALSKYLSEIKLSTAWQQSKSALRPGHRATSRSSGRARSSCRAGFRQSVVSFAQPGQLFEDLGITYIGVMPGHDLRLLEETFRRALALNGPVIVHVRTQKGKGYKPAETDQISFHGAALPPMTVPRPPTPTTGCTRTATRWRPRPPPARTSPPAAGRGRAPPSASVMADRRGSPPTTPRARAEPPPAAGRRRRRRRRTTPRSSPRSSSSSAPTDRRIVAITAGMPTGTGLTSSRRRTPTGSSTSASRSSTP